MRCHSLEEVRSNIDRIDNEIIKLIATGQKGIEKDRIQKRDRRGHCDDCCGILQNGFSKSRKNN